MTNEQLAVLLEVIANDFEDAISIVDDDLGNSVPRYQELANCMQALAGEEAVYVDGDAIVLEQLREKISGIRENIKMLKGGGAD